MTPLLYVVELLIVLSARAGAGALLPPARKVPSPPPPKGLVQRNGVRMVGPSGYRGRLEVSYNANGSIVWNPVCDTPAFDDNTAQVMCKLLGFKSGKRYYSQRLPLAYAPASPPVTAWGAAPVSNLTCYTRNITIGTTGSATSAAAVTNSGTTGSRSDSSSHHRRLLAAEPRIPHAATAGRQHTASRSPVVAQTAAVHPGATLALMRGRHQRSLQAAPPSAAMRYAVNIPASAHVSCTVQDGNCGPRGPVVSIECSDTIPSPPPPPPSPMPPSPQPAPPPAGPSIRLIGGNYQPTSVEPNLCGAGLAGGRNLSGTDYDYDYGGDYSGADYDPCGNYGRIEVLVNAPPGRIGSKIWAPLCTNPQLSYLIGTVACRQAFNFPNAYPEITWDVIPNVPRTGGGFPIPQGPVSGQGMFNPAAYAGWVSVGGGEVDSAQLDSFKRVQDLELQVSSTPCENGALFALSCTIRMERHR